MLARRADARMFSEFPGVNFFGDRVQTDKQTDRQTAAL